ncbi:uncharacterized protein LOC107429953 isoform X1 [Ziziphus jujuba]|uniref:Uncharacterized protein LOC107429953 isoform X1 n=2 Tax=Ziziphus jujuba TaxID=326968 RepID=A0A6P4AM14_ZIZJJ|nr:uncharacterized protein LOC107429953 isoform X1 [Ziziphus jujuba]
MVAKDSPDWLPAGWSVQFSPLKTGRRVQNFVNMETGKKFSSKDDVLYYIKMVNAAHRKPLSINRHIQRHSGTNPLQRVNVKAKKPEWLPKGWKMEMKTRKSGGQRGLDYKCYIDPLNGYKFYSKPEVFRYLSTVKHKNHMFKRKKTGISVHSAEKVAADKNKVEDLSPKQIKEIRITRSSNEINKNLPSSEAKRQKLEHPVTRRQHFSGEKSSGMSDLEQLEIGVSKKSCLRRVSTEAGVASARTAEIVQEKHSLGNAIHDSSKTKQNCALHGSPQSKVKGTKRNQGKRSLLSETDELKKSQGKSYVENGLASTPAPDMLQEKNLIQPLIDKQSFRKPHMNTGRAKNKKHLNLSRRSSKRLAGIEPDQVVKLVSAERGPKVTKRKSGKIGAILDAGLSSNRMVDGESTQHELGQETELAHQAFSGINHGVSSNMSTKPSADQVAHVELKQNLESGKVESEKAESHISFLFGSDPCLEFAFKTLTGELPVTDAADGWPNLSTAAGRLQDNNLNESGMKKNSDGTGFVQLKKSKKKKDITLPKRSSNRLAGLEPELVAGSLAGEGKLKNAPRKSHQNEAPRADDLADETIHPLEPVLETKLGNDFSSNIETSMHSEPSRKQSDNGHKVELSNHFFAYTDTLVHERKQLDAGPEMEFPNLNINMSMHEEPSNKQPSRKQSDNGHKVELANHFLANTDTLVHEELSSKQLDAGPETEFPNLNINMSMHEEPSNKQPSRKQSDNGHKVELATLVHEEPSSKQFDAGPETEFPNLNINMSMHEEPSNKQPSRKQSNNGHKVELANHFLANTDTLVHEEPSNKKLDAGPETEFPNLNINISMHEEPSNEQPSSKHSNNGHKVELTNHFLANTDTLVHQELSNKRLDTGPETEFRNLNFSMHEEPSNKKLDAGPEKEFPNLNTSNSMNEEPSINPNLDTNISMHEEPSNEQLDAGPETEFPNLNRNTSVHEEPSNKQLDNGKEVEPANYLSNYRDLSTHGEPSNESEKSPDELVVPEKHPKVQGHIQDVEKPDPQVAFSLGDCWSDPCLDFAFKTLTGAIPIEDNLVQGYFQEQLDTSHSQRNGNLALPDFGSLSFFQSDISSHFDSPEKSVSGQQLSSSSSFLPAGNANLPSCSGIHSQQHCLESDKDFHGKVKS